MISIPATRMGILNLIKCSISLARLLPLLPLVRILASEGACMWRKRSRYCLATGRLALSTRVVNESVRVYVVFSCPELCFNGGGVMLGVIGE